jgi:hypothetical protein
MAARSRQMLAFLVLVAGFLVIPETTGSANACASQHLTAILGGFEGGGSPSSFYWVSENDSPGVFRIDVEIDGCSAAGPDPAFVNWHTTDVTATAGVDYLSTTGPSNNLNVPTCGAESHCLRNRIVNVPILNDADQGVSETVRINISTNSGRTVPPDELPLHIVDDDGASPRIAFAQPLQPYTQREHFTTARIPVFRGGSASGPATATFSLAGGAPNPATPSADFSPTSGQVQFAAGERLAFITIAIMNDTSQESSETIEATLSGTGVEGPSSTPVTIIDNDSDFQAPVTRFHHPRNGLRYTFNDYRIREIHTFFSDPGGSGVVKAWIALRRQRVSGSCAWFTGSGWSADACGAKRWVLMKFSRTGDLFFIRPGRLSPSIGTKIKNYRAWTRAEDGAGNLETSFQVGRNLSTFEVRRR